MIGRCAVSIGVTESIGTETQHVLISQADIALYEAKRSKLTAVIYHAGLTATARRATTCRPTTRRHSRRRSREPSTQRRSARAATRRPWQSSASRSAPISASTAPAPEVLELTADEEPSAIVAA